MARMKSLSDIGIYVKDQKKARQFYTRTLGLKVRSAMPKFGYIALGTTLKGDDASVNLWQPDPSWGPEVYDMGLKQLGTVTGIGFRTGSVERTVESMKRRRVKVEVSEESTGEPFARFEDPDGNVLFVFEPARQKVRRAGLNALDFVTVVTRDLGRSGDFFTKGLGMKGKKTPEGFAEYRLSPKGTAVMPFTPNREMYSDPSDYDEDMAHIGEETSIGFEVRDIYALQEQLMARGVRFLKKAEKTEWGGIQARILDPDDNVYSVIEMA